MKLVPALFKSANVLEIAAPVRECLKRQQAKIFCLTRMWRSYVRRVWGGEALPSKSSQAPLSSPLSKLLTSP